MDCKKDPVLHEGLFSQVRDFQSMPSKHGDLCAWMERTKIPTRHFSGSRIGEKDPLDESLLGIKNLNPYKSYAGSVFNCSSQACHGWAIPFATWVLM